MWRTKCHILPVSDSRQLAPCSAFMHLHFITVKENAVWHPPPSQNTALTCRGILDFLSREGAVLPPQGIHSVLWCSWMPLVALWDAWILITFCQCGLLIKLRDWKADKFGLHLSYRAVTKTWHHKVMKGLLFKYHQYSINSIHDAFSWHSR